MNTARLPIKKTLPVVAVIAGICLAGNETGGQSAGPRAELVATNYVRLTGDVDSNSPAVWNLAQGRFQFFVMTSFAGLPSTATGASLVRLGTPKPIVMEPWPDGGVWMEAVVADEDGTWYGYYHNEVPATACPGSTKMVPRIGAARSSDRGQTWESLGIILEAPRNSYDCITNNRYFVGGVGDLSVQVDHDSRDLYIFFSEYLRTPQQQGVAVARMAWADRDAPAGKLMVWRTRSWIPASRAMMTSGDLTLAYQAALPIFSLELPFHDNDTAVDVFWGPSVHWNTYLEQYVMLLNRAQDENFRQGGVYVSFAPRLDDPRLWSDPQKILNGGKWYPQVIGLEGGVGTDKIAGETARFFMSGSSEHLIHFIR